MFVHLLVEFELAPHWIELPVEVIGCDNASSSLLYTDLFTMLPSEGSVQSNGKVTGKCGCTHQLPYALCVLSDVAVCCSGCCGFFAAVIRFVQKVGRVNC